MPVAVRSTAGGDDGVIGGAPDSRGDDNGMLNLHRVHGIQLVFVRTGETER